MPDECETARQENDDEIEKPEDRQDSTERDGIVVQEKRGEGTDDLCWSAGGQRGTAVFRSNISQQRKAIHHVETFGVQSYDSIHVRTVSLCLHLILSSYQRIFLS